MDRDFGIVDGESPTNVHFRNAVTGMTRCGKRFVALAPNEARVRPLCPTCLASWDDDTNR